MVRTIRYAQPDGEAPPAAPANAQVEYVPAFSRDLPTGQADLTAADGKRPSVGMNPAVTWICTVYASDPSVAIHSSRQSIEGEGWQNCTGTAYWRGSAGAFARVRPANPARTR